MQSGRLRASEVLHIYSMGKRFQVTAMFDDTPEGTWQANAFCERHDSSAVIACCGGIIFVAHRYSGVKDADDRY